MTYKKMPIAEMSWTTYCREKKKPTNHQTQQQMQIK